MLPPKDITSPKNPLIQEVTQLLTRPKERRAHNKLIAEGLREIERALRAGWELETLLYRPDLTPPEAISALTAHAPPLSPTDPTRHHTLHARCAPEAFSKIAYRADVPNAVAVLRGRPHTLSALSDALAARPDASPELLLIIEGVEKPGNLGALLRTADALGVSGALLCDCPCDLYHPNALRNSLGGAFSVPTATCASAEAISWLKARGARLVVTHLEGARPPYALDLRGPTAIVLGAEDRGVSAAWVEAADDLALIPMRGVVDSLNVSAAAAMTLYEAHRQRALSAP